MLEQFIVSGLSGLVIVVVFFGFRNIVRVVNDHDDRGLSWDDSFKNNMKGTSDWITSVISIIVVAVIILGLLSSFFG